MSIDMVNAEDGGRTVEVAIEYITRLEHELAATRAELCRKDDQVKSLSKLVDLFRITWRSCYKYSRELEGQLAPLLNPRTRQEMLPYTVYS
ncbi:hypothetical protein PYCCODRAFT_1472636 [Trametes coccinea BRFM310]|uniref:Uncharacterized protein n=1 Tax=Trametes coccinea (strain BRFM310) TaxID=1353009 RepID=A0A1Y2I7Q6_TRAC3|nr:hypothetical protein PYCCODRAFT_1472636 [Trametes coccinea BRFM310]